MTHNIFQHHNRIVHHQPHCQRNPQQGYIVETVSKPIEQNQRSEQRNRQRHGRDQRGCGMPQEKKDHQHHQYHRQGEREVDVVDGFTDGHRVIAGQRDLERIGHLRLQAWQKRAYGIDYLDDIRIDPTLHLQGNRIVTVIAGGRSD